MDNFRLPVDNSHSAPSCISQRVPFLGEQDGVYVIGETYIVLSGLNSVQMAYSPSGACVSGRGASVLIPNKSTWATLEMTSCARIVAGAAQRGLSFQARPDRSYLAGQNLVLGLDSASFVRERGRGETLKGGDSMGTQIVARIPRGKTEYQLRLVTCGKPNCSRCPHGPYWYLMIRLRSGGSVKRYIGRDAPEDLTDAELDSVGLSRTLPAGMPEENESVNGEEALP